jgi:hypothetical protein
MENHYGEKLPEVGLFTHTKIPQLYEVDKNVWLVDFPGSNGIENYADYWLHFSALPNVVLLLLEFTVLTIPSNHFILCLKTYNVCIASKICVTFLVY